MVKEIQHNKLFRGRHRATVDSSSRIKLPEEYCRIINEYYPNKYFVLNEVYIKTSFFSSKKYPHIEVIPKSTYKKLKRKRKNQGYLDNLIQMTMIDNIELVSKDRLPIPEVMRGDTNINENREVMIIGNLEFFLIFEYEIYKKFFDKYKGKNKPLVKI